MPGTPYGAVAKAHPRAPGPRGGLVAFLKNPRHKSAGGPRSHESGIPPPCELGGGPCAGAVDGAPIPGERE
mgnify:CR=1 FL=1